MNIWKGLRLAGESKSLFKKSFKPLELAHIGSLMCGTINLESVQESKENENREKSVF